MRQNDVKKLHYKKGALKRTLGVKDNMPGSLISVINKRKTNPKKRDVAIKGVI